MMNIVKKSGVLLIGVLCMAWAFALAGCAGKPDVSSDQLDAAIRETSDYLNAHLEQGNKLVILNIESEFPALSEYIIDELIANTVNDRVFTVVDRRQLDSIRTELDFQYSGEVDDDTMQALGRMAGAQIIISGAVSKIGDLYRLRVRALSVQTAQIEGQFNRNILDGPIIAALVGSQATGYGDASGAGSRAASTSPAAAPSAAPASAPAASNTPAPAPAAPVPAPTTPVPANMIWVEGGSAMMGSTDGENDERPVHQITVSGFYMGKYEVTQKEWVVLMGSNPSQFKGDNLPVESVSWYEVVNYCNARSQYEGLTPAYTVSGTTVTWNRSANGYRLPTEAEWEYATRRWRLGDSVIYEYAGSNTVGDVGWYSGNSGSRTHEVGTKMANALGLYDLSGNVWEWCWDWYGSYASGAQTDPMGASSGSARVRRGGCWANVGQYLRSAFRYFVSPSDRYYNLGFRLLRP
jgi:formylglycine-generating enzyme required for sulfatase activity